MTDRDKFGNEEASVYYRDLQLKIGDKIYCTNLDDFDYWEQHLTIGKMYTMNYTQIFSLCVVHCNGIDLHIYP